MAQDNQNTNYLSTELQELQRTMKTVLQKLDNLKTNHFGPATLATRKTYPDGIVKQVQSIRTDFDAANSGLKRIERQIHDMRDKPPQLHNKP